MSEIEKNCGSCSDKKNCVSFLSHENAMMHKDMDNERAHRTTLFVCIAFVLIVMLNDWGELEPAYYVDTDTVYNYPDLCYGRWLVTYAAGRRGMGMPKAVAAELLDAYNNTGNVVKKRDDTHKMAQANRAFAHYAF